MISALVVGCGPGGMSDEGSQTSSSTTGASADSTPETSSESETSTETSTETGTETGTASVCGDGVVDSGESCDDGNTLDGDTCPGDCIVPLRECGFVVWECGDGVDNDDDGLVDLYDPECFSPCDDDEGSFDRATPGVSNQCRLDCGWDSNLLPGDDGCASDLRCDPENPGGDFGCGYDPLIPSAWCELTPECLVECLPMTPNGCDCLGCCEVNGAFVWLARYAHCGVEDIGACGSCTPDLECVNPCEPEACELCFLQGPNDLADGCAAPSCPNGVEPCVDPYACPEDQVCQGGCCLDFEF